MLCGFELYPRWVPLTFPRRASHALRPVLARPKDPEKK